MPPPGDGGVDGGVPDNERRELIQLLGELSHAELALIRANTPCISWHRLPKGQFGYSGHAISPANKGPSVALSLPRPPDNAGLNIIVDHGKKGTALNNPGVRMVFRVRRTKIQRALTLLIKHNKYYARLYGNIGIDNVALAALPEDGIPDSIPILHEDREAPAPPRGELTITTPALKAWLEEGDENEVEYPIANAAYRCFSRAFDLSHGIGALASHIQGSTDGGPRSEMIRLSDIAEAMIDGGASSALPGYDDYDAGNKPKSRRRTKVNHPDAEKRSHHKGDAAKKRLANKKEKEAADKLNDQWSKIDSAIVAEFQGIAEKTVYTEDHSCVPSGYVPKRTEAEADDAKLGEILQDEATVEKVKAKEAERTHGSETAVPERGAAINEHTQGFWPLSYPELFPFGRGCFNEPRQRKVTFDQWVAWAVHQDMSAVAPPPTAPDSLNTSDQITKAKEEGTAVSFTGEKRKGTKSGARWASYRRATTIDEALRMGATPSDIQHDLDNGLMAIQNVRAPPPVLGSGNMRHMSNLRFTFHAMNYRFRERAMSASRAFVRGLPCDSKNDGAVANFLRNCDAGALSNKLLRFTKSMPNSPQFFNMHRKNLHNMIDELGPPTFFSTASAADTECPHLHKLIVEWAGLAGTIRDPFVPNLTPSESKKRRFRNLAEYPAIASWFWDQKSDLVQKGLLPLLGVTSFWERTEYQSRGSCHGHALWWHPNAPPDSFLDVIGAFANAIVTDEAKAEVKDANNEETNAEDVFNEERCAEIANDFASCSPAAFEYDAGELRLDDTGTPILKREYKDTIRFTAEFTEEVIMEAVRQARQASGWYSRFLDASSAFYDEASKQVLQSAVDRGHPSSRNILNYGEMPPDFWETDYQECRRDTCRHTECRKSYCLRERSDTKEIYCRFEESLRVRQLRGAESEEAGNDQPADEPPGPESPRVRAPTHYYAEVAHAKDGSVLLRWRLYVGKGPVENGMPLCVALWCVSLVTSPFPWCVFMSTCRPRRRRPVH